MVDPLKKNKTKQKFCVRIFQTREDRSKTEILLERRVYVYYDRRLPPSKFSTNFISVTLFTIKSFNGYLYIVFELNFFQPLSLRTKQKNKKTKTKTLFQYSVYE